MYTKAFRSIAVIAVSCLLISGCASTNYLKQDESERTYSLPFNSMMVLVPQALEIAGMKVKEVKDAEGIVMGTAPPSFWTSSLANIVAGGDEVKIYVRPVDDNSSHVSVTVVATADIMDLGRSARVVRTFYRHLDNIVRQKLSSIK